MIVDVGFVNLPADFRFPCRDWCLGYRHMMATLREAGFSSRIFYPPRVLDGSARGQLLRDLLQAEPRIVGWTTFDPQLPATLQFIRDARSLGLRSHVTLGGVCASAVPGELLTQVPAINSVVLGEGELAVVDLARHVIRGDGPLPIPGVWLRQGDGISRGPPRSFMGSLDSLPPPVMDDFPGDGHTPGLPETNGCAFTHASRGCYGRCTFCSVQRFYRAAPGRVWRPRCAPAVAREAAESLRRTGFRKLTFVDENFMGPGETGRTHAAAIGRAVGAFDPPVQFNFGCRPDDVRHEVMAALKACGLAGVTLGIESMAPTALAAFNKHTTPEVNRRALTVLEELGISAEITFIFFHPRSTLEEVRRNLEFVDWVRQARHAYFSSQQPFTEYLPFFGTEMTRDLVRSGLAATALDGGSIRYADRRVGFLAGQLRRIPVEQLGRLRCALPVIGSARIQEIQATLADYQAHLTLRRLPELAGSLCDALERQSMPNSRTVRGITRELAAEKARIQALIGRFASHLPS